MQKKNYITPQGLEKLKKEQSDLFHGERPKVVETVTWAASNGDRSENADYLYGKKRLREIDSRLRFLNQRIESAIVVDPAQLSGDKVVFGVWITVLDAEGEEHQYRIVGEDEFDLKNNYISWQSPLAKAMLGKKVGDIVTVNRPSGSCEYELLAINFSHKKDIYNGNT